MAKQKKRYKPTVRQICVIGTLAHNRPSFTMNELRQYIRFDGHDYYKLDTKQFTAWLKRHGLARDAGGGRGKLYPTSKGWKMIEKACGTR